MPPNYVEPTLSSGINGQSKPESVASQQSQVVAQIRQEYNELKSKASILSLKHFPLFFFFFFLLPLIINTWLLEH